MVQVCPEPSSEQGKITVWKGMLSLPMKCTSFTSPGRRHQSSQRSVRLAVIEM